MANNNNNNTEHERPTFAARMAALGRSISGRRAGTETAQRPPLLNDPAVNRHREYALDALEGRTPQNLDPSFDEWSTFLDKAKAEKQARIEAEMMEAERINPPPPPPPKDTARYSKKPLPTIPRRPLPGSPPPPPPPPKDGRK